MIISRVKHFATNYINRTAREIVELTNNLFYSHKAFKGGLKFTKSGIHKKQLDILTEEIDRVLYRQTERLKNIDLELSKQVNSIPTCFVVHTHPDTGNVTFQLKTWYKNDPKQHFVSHVETHITVGPNAYKALGINQDGYSNRNLVNNLFPLESYNKLQLADQRVIALQEAVKSINGEIDSIKNEVGRVYFDI